MVPPRLISHDIQRAGPDRRGNPGAAAGTTPTASRPVRLMLGQKRAPDFDHGRKLPRKRPHARPASPARHPPGCLLATTDWV